MPKSNKKKLTGTSIETVSQRVLFENRQEVLFTPVFNRKMDNGYDFTDLCKNRQSVLYFQKLLAEWSNLTVSQMDESFKRRNDETDQVDEDDAQVIHYGKDREKFRLHGVYRNGRFEVTRIDQGHDFHKTK